MKALQTRTVFPLPPQLRGAPLHKSTCSESLEIEIQRSKKAGFYLGLNFCTPACVPSFMVQANMKIWNGFSGSASKGNQNQKPLTKQVYRFSV